MHISLTFYFDGNMNADKNKFNRGKFVMKTLCVNINKYNYLSGEGSLGFSCIDSSSA